MGGRGSNSMWRIGGNMADMDENQDVPQTVTNVGRLSHIEAIEAVYGELRTEEVVLTQKQYEHVEKEHPEAAEELWKYKKEIIENPDYILSDERNKNTVQFIKNLPGKTGRAIIKVAVANGGSEEWRKNSILTYHNINEKELKRLKRKNTILYSRW